jgi:gamma-glutamylcyclotransferase (GGCT)/AIG2-like uncharacterized protein YtfP
MHLFVYGTLRSTGPAHVPMIARHAVSILSATLPDHALYGRGLAYPFVAPRRGSVVVGEIVEVRQDDWSDLIERLDQYEGDDYERHIASARSITGPVDVQVYVASSHVDLDERLIVPSGDWAGVS